MNQIQGLFLDLDGTLADSMLVLRKAFTRFTDQLGIDPKSGDFREMAGVRLPEIMVLLKQHYNLPQSPEQLVNMYLDAIGDGYEKHAKPAPGARALLQAAQERGVHVAVVTSSPQQVARDFLEAHGLSGYVANLVSADNVGQGKPHPEPFMTALQQAGLPAEQGLAVEDSAAGAKSAMGAGLSTYLISLYDTHPKVEGVAGHITRLDELVGLIG
jgi:HAD superfamily hydrolase (TIGR01509 family)